MLADQPLAGVHRVAAGGAYAGRRVVAVEHEHRVVGARRGLGLREVSNGALEVPELPAALLLTYHTQPEIWIVTVPVSVSSGVPLSSSV